ncbi:hypothetical protein FISHEDRAFT_72006 [Fistulina hepatica ATCC 64428]|uniref:Uncharacterized protein n=1 Tax=Fistulina hepatica ATCC 64428 TaxID=1128425 RepID=A0A0D7AG33_9AGAR|nr:hypothetical protein FISHEDRAFT_72006 [Fistulina hepatica ATCC 64428]
MISVTLSHATHLAPFDRRRRSANPSELTLTPSPRDRHQPPIPSLSSPPRPRSLPRLASSRSPSLAVDPSPSRRPAARRRRRARAREPDRPANIHPEGANAPSSTHHYHLARPFPPRRDDDDVRASASPAGRPTSTPREPTLPRAHTTTTTTTTRVVPCVARSTPSPQHATHLHLRTHPLPPEGRPASPRPSDQPRSSAQRLNALCARADDDCAHAARARARALTNVARSPLGGSHVVVAHARARVPCAV